MRNHPFRRIKRGNNTNDIFHVPPSLTLITLLRDHLHPHRSEANTINGLLEEAHQRWIDDLDDIVLCWIVVEIYRRRGGFRDFRGVVSLFRIGAPDKT